MITSDVDIVYTNVVVLSKIYKFVVDNFFYLKSFGSSKYSFLSSLIFKFNFFLIFKQPLINVEVAYIKIVLSTCSTTL